MIRICILKTPVNMVGPTGENARSAPQISLRDGSSDRIAPRRTATSYARELKNVSQFFSIRATACAAMPSPSPVKPSFSSVVAFTLT